jgi:hypothetical protein
MASVKAPAAFFAAVAMISVLTLVIVHAASAGQIEAIRASMAGVA